MPDDQAPQTDEQFVTSALNARIASARAGLQRLNELVGEERYKEPPEWATRGCIVALASILVELGLATSDQITQRMAAAQGNILEEALEEARVDYTNREHKPAPMGWMSRPQG